jgi:hypothetical protein
MTNATMMLAAQGDPTRPAVLKPGGWTPTLQAYATEAAR